MKRVVKLIMIMILIGGITLTNNPFYIERRGAEYYIEWIGFEDNNQSEGKYQENQNNTHEEKSSQPQKSTKIVKDNGNNNLNKKQASTSEAKTSTNQENEIQQNINNDRPTQTELDSCASKVQAYLFDNINLLRTGAGLTPLVSDSKVQQIAEIRGKELLIKYSHDRPNGESVTTMLKGYQSGGENIAYVGGSDFTPTEENLKEAAADFATNWASSPGHYANIVNPKATMQGLKVVAVYEYNENFQMYGWGFYAANIFAG